MDQPRIARNVTSLFVALTVLLGVLVVSPVRVEAKATPGGPSAGGRCNPRKGPCPSESSQPVIEIESPLAGETVPGTFTVSGQAMDDAGVSAVDLRVDAGPWQRASGTGGWTGSLAADTPAGEDVTITARATDVDGNVTATSVVVTSAGQQTDDAAPAVNITAPSSGSSVSGPFTVTGTATDDLAVSTVEVRIDSKPAVEAAGTTEWSAHLDATDLADGPHTVTAVATDGAGNASTTSVSIVVSQTTPAAVDEWVVNDPRASYALLPLGRTRLASFGSVTGVLYTEQFTNRRAIAFRDAESGAISHVDLPTDGVAGWTSAATVMTSAHDLWIFGGSGPMYARHYRLDGSPLPSSATLVESRVLGDSDSREGDMIALASGGLVLTWHQQGATGPQGIFVAHRDAGGHWRQLPALTFMPSQASDQVLGQHPADGSVWLFNNPDGWGSIGAVHLTESADGLRVDWTDDGFVDPLEHGLHGPDPENPNLALAVDQAAGTLSLAYQSADRKRFSNGMIGSRIAIAAVTPSADLSFVVLPVWAERVSAVGLVASGGGLTVSYRPIDESTLTFDEVWVSRYRAGTWEPGILFGTIGSTDRVTFGSPRPEFSTRLDDGTIHLRMF